MSTRTTPRIPQSTLGLLAMLIAAGTTLSAQIAAPNNPSPETEKPQITPTPTTAKPEGEIVELSPFTVNADADAGWRAQNTLAGSRMNSSLKDTPGVLDVLTKEFLDDVGVTTLAEALNYSANYEENFGDLSGSSIINTSFPGANQGLNFTTRGQDGRLARNFLATNFRPEFYTIERIDNSSGPNAILFGIGSAGGVANVSTKRAKLNRNAFTVDLRADDNHGFRTAIDANQVLIPKRLGLRVNAIADRAQTFRKYSDNDLSGLHLTLKYRANERTEINIEYELDHTKGLIVDPRPVNERITTWLAAGAQTVTVPTNWDTLAATPRTTLLNTYLPLGINSATATDRPVYISNGDQSFVFNARNSLQSIGATNPLVTDETLAPFSVNLSGPGGRKEINRELLALSIDHRLATNLFFNISASRERGDAYTYQSFPGTGNGMNAITGDPNVVLNNLSQLVNPNGVVFATNGAGQTLNPYAGQWFVDGRWRRRQSENDRDIAQATLAWKLDAGRWGNHNFVTSASYGENSGNAQQLDEQWFGAPFNNTVSNVNNAVIRRRYITPGDAGSYYAADWIDSQDLTWTHPTRGLLTTTWVPIDSTRGESRDKSALVAAQSYWFNRRLVTTIGYRLDEQVNDQYLSYLARPPGYTASSGIPTIDDTSLINETTTRGASKTLGLVYHVTNWISVYGNSSNSISPAPGNRFGPDGLRGPNPKGEGIDFGLKFEFADNKYSLDLGYYDTSNVNTNERLNIQNRGADSVYFTWNQIFATLNAPAGAPQLLNTSDQAALDALKAQYSEIRPVWQADADLLDKSSTGYEARFTANPINGLRLRATYSYTESAKENLLKNTLLARQQLNAYIDELKAKNPTLNVGSLSLGGAGDLTINQNLDAMDFYIQEAIDFNTNSFGSAKHRFNFNGSYDLPGRLKGWTIGTGTNYRSGSVVSSYQIIDPAAPRVLIQEIPIYGPSNITWSGMLRYATKVNYFGSKAKLSIQLNISNLFDQTDLQVRRYATITVAPGAALPPPTNPTSLFITAPRSWSLSARFDF